MQVNPHHIVVMVMNKSFDVSCCMFHRNYSDSHIEFGDSSIKEDRTVAIIKILFKQLNLLI
jgi:hypothetical protein